MSAVRGLRAWMRYTRLLQYSVLHAVSKQNTGSASTACRCDSLLHCAARAARTRSRCSSVQAKFCSDACKDKACVSTAIVR